METVHEIILKPDLTIRYSNAFQVILIRSGGCTVERDEQFDEGFETNKLDYGDSDDKKKTTWQALLEEKHEWIMLNSRVICDLIAYVLLVNCAPPRIAYALTNVDNPQNCVRPELKLFTESCGVGGPLLVHMDSIGILQSTVYRLDLCCTSM